MKKILIKQLLEFILPFIKENILKFEKQLATQMQAIPLHEKEENVVFMVYCDKETQALKGGLGVLENGTDQEGKPVIILGRPIAINGETEINFSQLLLQFSEIDNKLIISEAQNLPDITTPPAGETIEKESIVNLKS